MGLVLVDTSVWINHFRSAHPSLKSLLQDAMVVSHPFVIGELAVGHLGPRDAILRSIQDLPSTTSVAAGEILTFIEVHKLFGRGIGLVDVHLLATLKLSPGVSLWTTDKRLHAVATELLIPAFPMLH